VWGNLSLLYLNGAETLHSQGPALRGILKSERSMDQSGTYISFGFKDIKRVMKIEIPRYSFASFYSLLLLFSSASCERDKGNIRQKEPASSDLLLVD
jgi:hypothetical protein